LGGSRGIDRFFSDAKSDAKSDTKLDAKSDAKKTARIEKIMVKKWQGESSDRLNQSLKQRPYQVPHFVLQF